ncbi:MAG: PLP-dependent cysteine synthase family protein [Chitinophagales bacterium]
MYLNNILETIGKTPLIKLNRVPQLHGIKATVLAKVEYFNPGNSVKDRIALRVIDNAEEKGWLKPGGVIIEGTSGNTGTGLALVAAVRGYRCIFTTSKPASNIKIKLLKALGAQVVHCPKVPAEDPRSYYSIAASLNETIPNSYHVNQYENPMNPQVHYETTGPEIWEQTGGTVTHLITGTGTGGTLSGNARFLKEKNPDLKVIGVDAYGSTLKKFHETKVVPKSEDLYGTKIEGVGKDMIPSTIAFDLIDKFVYVNERDSALRTRELASLEGMILGYSCGAAFQGIVELKDELTEEDVVVVIFHDHGSRYVNKMYSDEWMEEEGFSDNYEDEATRQLKEYIGEVCSTADAIAEVIQPV